MEGPFPLIVITSAGAGLSAGFLMHRSDFCVASMFRDLFLFRGFYMLHMLGLLVVVSLALFEFGRLAGWLSPEPFPLLGPPSLASLIGGFVFGIGMVLAGGCVVGSLYKMGAGSALSAVAFLGLLVGSALYAEWHPVWSAFASATTFTDARTLAQWLALPSAGLTLPLAALGAFGFYRLHRAGRLARPGYTKGHIQPWQAAVGLAVIGFGSYLLVGMPLGITTAYAKLGAGIERLFLPDHVAALDYFALTPLVYVPPFSSVTVSGGAGPQWDAIAAIQYPLIGGIVLGGFLSAVWLREFRLRYRAPVRQYASALVGGLLLGAAARMTPGCNVWHLWGGVPILALQSLLFLAGLVPGAWAGSRLLTRLVVR